MSAPTHRTIKELVKVRKDIADAEMGGANVLTDIINAYIALIEKTQEGAGRCS